MTEDKLKEVLKDKDLIIDLDNTIYEETDYLFQAYKKIADVLSQKYDKISSESVYSFLKETFQKNGRKRIFDKLIKRFDLDNDISLMLNILRNVKIPCKIEPFPKITKLISYVLKCNNKVIVFTNGNYLQQKNKLNYINFGHFKNELIFEFAVLYEPKPSTLGLEIIIDKYSLDKESIIYIGDSKFDELPANKMNILFLNVNQIV